jgi:DNA ligase-1
MLPLDEFQSGKSKHGAVRRKIDLHCFFDASPMNYSTEVAPLYMGDDMEQITVWTNYAKENGWEGCMVNIDAPYECKRTSNLLKLKEMQSNDLIVVSVEEGEGKYKGMMGKCVVEYKGGEVGVGSGWKDDERQYYWENPDELIGRVVEVQFFEQSIDSKTKQVSLRFPIFKCIREIGKCVSYD